jgi:cyclase
LKKLSTGVYASTEYAGVNVGFITVPGGAVAVDAPTLPGDARAWRHRVEEGAGGPILYVVLTDAHPDRLLSAGALGAPIVASRAAYDRAARLLEGSWRAAAEGWARSEPRAAKPLAKPPLALPEIILVSRLTLRRDDETVTVEAVAGAAPGSVWVHLPDHGVLFAGDTIVADRHPHMESTPDSRGWLNTLKRLRRSAFAKTTIVPGRGPLCTQADTSPLSEYIALIRRRARSLRQGGRAGLAAAAAELVELYAEPASTRETAEQQARANLEQAIREAGGASG